MMKRDVPVYLITGFLESGKTQFLDFTIHQSYFQIPDKTLLILCEEGEEEYDEESLKKMNTVIEIIEDPEDFNADTLQMLNKKHQPGRVLVEYNPLWSVDKFYQTDMPRYWDLAQHIVTVDASTFQIYMNNMKSLFMEMIRNADLVIFNRCQDEHPLANFRRSVKVVNSRAEVVFENEEGEIDDIFQDEMPYDMNADIIDIEDIDYGIWYVDMMDNLDKYVDKTVRFKGQVLKSRELNAGFFVPGRMAMTCCADDTQFIGYICKNPAAKRLRIGSWVTVTAKVKDEFMEVYNGRGPVLYATEIEAAEITLLYNFYKEELKRELEAFLVAFRCGNDLYPDETARCYKENDVEAPERTDEEKRMLKKAAWYSNFMDKRKPPTALIGEPEEED